MRLKIACRIRKRRTWPTAGDLARRRIERVANGPFVNRVYHPDIDRRRKAIGWTAASIRWPIPRIIDATYYDEVGWNGFTEPNDRRITTIEHD